MNHSIKSNVFEKDSIDEFEISGLDDLLEEDDEENDPSSFSRSKEKVEEIDYNSLMKPETIVNKKKLYVAKTYSEFENYIMSNFTSNQKYIETKTIAYDIETNAQDPKSINAKIVGFSVSFSEDSGIYVVRESLEYTMPEEDWTRVVSLFRLLMDKSEHIVVHNRKYENPYTINCMNYEIKNEVIEDTMIKCRVLFPGEPAGLKPASARLLGYSDWDSELSMFTKNIKSIINESVHLKASKRTTGDKTNDLELYRDVFENMVYDEDPKTLHNFLYDGTYKMTEYALNFISVFQVLGLNGLINKEIFSLLLSNIRKFINLGGLDSDVIPYSMIPMKIISKYGAIDSVATYELNTYCDKLFDVKSNEIKSIIKSITNNDNFESFNLRKGYEIVKAQFDAGINLEMSGAKWNDEIAQKEYERYNKLAIESWYNLFKNSKFSKIIKEENKKPIIQKLIQKAIEEYLSETEFASSLVYDLLNVLSTKGKFEIKKTLVKFLDVVIEDGPSQGKFLSVKTSGLYDMFKEEFDTLLNDEFEKEFNSMIDRTKIKKYSDLKDVYNPNKSTSDHYNMIDSILNSNELKFATFYQNCYKQLSLDKYWEQPSFNTSKNSQLIIEMYRFLEYVKKYNENQNMKNEKPLDQKLVISKFSSLVKDIDVSQDEVLRQHLINSSNYKINSLEDKFIIDLAGKFVSSGVDLEDRSTWGEDFEFLYNLRIYKKSVKMITSYIEGAVGRKSVSVVKKSEIDSLLPLRQRSYYESNGEYSEDEELLMSTEFAVCMAETGRWKSGFHTVPAGSTIKNIYTSRYKGGVICAPDYSQMEVRAVAASAKEDVMLNVFKNNEDIHLKTASSVYKKPVENVTDAERKFSKTVTFAIIYGANEKTISKSMGDDLAAAKELLDNFYEGYPKLKEWIDTMHKLWEKTGYVVLSSNRIIKIEKPDKNDRTYFGKFNACKRNAQNYPIQGLSNDVAGYALYLIIKYIKENHLKSKAFSFVHDALYFDIHPNELFEVTEYINKIMNEYPTQEYNLPAAADMVIGVSMGQELKASKIKKTSETTGEMVLSGYEDEFNELIESWKEVYKSIEYEDLSEPKKEYFKMSELFVPKKPINPFTGTFRTKVSRKVYITLK